MTYDFTPQSILDSIQKPIDGMAKSASTFFTCPCKYKLSLDSSIASLSEFKPDEEINCAYTKTVGDLKVGFLLLLKSQSLKAIYDVFDTDEECSLSAVSELCNLLAGNFLTKLTEKDSRVFTLKAPVLSRDYFASISEIAESDFGLSVDGYSVVKINLDFNNYEFVFLMLIDDNALL